ncbi:MAG TPA: hypothetical protein VEW25_06735 [Allosphingosinicella sp.]|nr:hypothetical protein [Allosphingosinicella sp.]
MILAASLLAVAALAASSPAEHPGGPELRFGAMRICGATVGPAAKDSERRNYTVVIELRAEQRAQLYEETRRNVGRTLAIRFGERTIMEPIINEPIAGGSAHINAPSRAEIEALRRAAARPC